MSIDVLNSPVSPVPVPLAPPLLGPNDANGLYGGKPPREHGKSVLSSQVAQEESDPFGIILLTSAHDALTQSVINRRARLAAQLGEMGLSPNDMTGYFRNISIKDEQSYIRGFAEICGSAVLHNHSTITTRRQVAETASQLTGKNLSGLAIMTVFPYFDGLSLQTDKIPLDKGSFDQNMVVYYLACAFSFIRSKAMLQPWHEPFNPKICESTFTERRVPEHLTAAGMADPHILR